MGHDENCMAWIAKYRTAPPPGSEGEGRGRRENARRRRPEGA